MSGSLAGKCGDAAAERVQGQVDVGELGDMLSAHLHRRIPFFATRKVNQVQLGTPHLRRSTLLLLDVQLEDAVAAAGVLVHVCAAHSTVGFATGDDAQTIARACDQELRQAFNINTLRGRFMHSQWEQAVFVKQRVIDVLVVDLQIGGNNSDVL